MSPPKMKIKVIVAILSTDIHTRATIILSQAFRDAGMEVVYLGYGLTPDTVAQAAEAEDADVICLSSHQGFHMQLFPKLMEALKKRGLNDIAVVAGGNILDGEKPSLEGIGVTGNFGSGTPIDLIVSHVIEQATKKRQKKSQHP